MNTFIKYLNYLRILERRQYLSKKKKRLKNIRPTIIASNCVGTMIYWDMRLPAYSPMINLGLEMNDFVRFAEKLDWYLEQPLCMIKDDSVSYPVGMLADLRINFGHYDSWEQADKQWKMRCKYVDMNNLFLIGCEKDGCTYETIRRFDSLPYKNKIILTKKKYPEFSSAYQIRGFNEHEEMGSLIAFRKGLLLRRYMEDFDYVDFLNER